MSNTVKRSIYLKVARNIAKRYELGGPDKGEYADVRVISRKDYDGRAGTVIVCDYVDMTHEQMNRDIEDILLQEGDFFAEAVNGSILAIYPI